MGSQTYPLRNESTHLASSTMQWCASELVCYVKHIFFCLSIELSYLCPGIEAREWGSIILYCQNSLRIGSLHVKCMAKALNYKVNKSSPQVPLELCWTNWFGFLNFCSLFILLKVTYSFKVLMKQNVLLNSLLFLHYPFIWCITATLCFTCMYLPSASSCFYNTHVLSPKIVELKLMWVDTSHLKHDLMYISSSIGLIFSCKNILLFFAAIWTTAIPPLSQIPFPATRKQPPNTATKKQEDTNKAGRIKVMA